MTDETAAPAGGDDIAVIEDTGGELSIDDAAALVVNERKKPPAERAQPATADNELSEEDNAAPQEEAHGEDQGADPAAEPPIERPKSWTEAEDAEWRATPRALQQKIVARELERDNALRRTQNETAEKLKGLTVKEQQAEQARQNFEERAKSALKILEREQLRDFPDIKNIEDVRNLSVTDPLRYLQWDAHQKEMVAAHAAVQEANTRQANELKAKRTSYQSEQRSKLSEMVPDLADDKKFSEVWDKAMPELEKIGFTKPILSRWVESTEGYEILLSAGFQKLVADSLKLHGIETAAKAAAAKPLPPVQRPGSAQPRGAARDQNLQALSRKLDSSGDIEDAFAMLTAQRRAS